MVVFDIFTIINYKYVYTSTIPLYSGYTPMVRRRYSDKEEIEELRRENEELRRHIAILPKKMANDLHLIEKKVLEYIRKHPGTNKEKIISQLTEEGISSRVTIFKIIDNLEEYDLIKLRKHNDKPNCQVWKLYVNEDSIFLTVYYELDIFRNLFFDLIEKIIEKNLHQRTNNQRDDLLYHLLLICIHVLGTYLLYSVVKWPTQIHDIEIQNKLYAIVIYRLVKIVSKLSQAFKTSGRGMPDFRAATVGDVFNPILQAFTHHVFLLTPDTIVKILEDYKKYDLHNEIIPIIDSAWKIGFPIYLYGEPFLKVKPEHLDKFQNFRLAIANDSKEKKLKVSKEIWETLKDVPAQQHK
jgi:hypothetical protein